MAGGHRVRPTAPVRCDVQRRCGGHLHVWTVLFLLFFHFAEATECGAGRYLASTDVCTDCPAGRFMADTGHQHTECVECAVGTWTPATGTTECWTCPRSTNSTAGATACSIQPSCLPCIDRTSVKVRAVFHGRISVLFWARFRRVMQVAAHQMNVDFDISLQLRSSTQSFILDVENAVLEEPDIIIASIPNEDTIPVLQMAAAKSVLFTANSGAQWAKEAGSMGHFSMDDYLAAYNSADPFQEFFANRRGTNLTHCLVLHHELGNEALDLRASGFAQACLERGLVAMPVVYVNAASTEALEAAVRASVVNWTAQASEEQGLGILLLGGFANTALEAYSNAGSPSNVLLGAFDADEYTDQGMEDGLIAFTIDQGLFLQAYLPLVISVIYVTTGRLMAVENYNTGARFSTTARTAEVAQRENEGWPICDCPWAAGLEESLECGPDVPGITAIGDCPLMNEECSSPCLDIRKFEVAGVTPGREGSVFWFEVKGGGEQAANDLRLIRHDVDLFKPRGTEGGFTFDGYVEKLRTYADDPDIDAIYYMAFMDGPISEALEYAAARKPVVTFNSGLPFSKAAAAKDGLQVLNYVGTNEYLAGVNGAKKLAAMGATHIICIKPETGFDNFDNRCAGTVAGSDAAGITSTTVWINNAISGEDVLVDLDNDVAIQNRIEDLMNAAPGFDAVMNLAGYTLQPALAALANLGRDQTLMGTFDTDSDTLSEIEAGRVHFAIDQVSYMQGYMSVILLAVHHMSGQYLFEHHVTSGPFLRTAPENEGDECGKQLWDATDSEGNYLVGERFLPSFDASACSGYLVCERVGTCEVAGTYFDEASLNCQQCPVGTYANSTMIACEPCPAGTSTGGSTGSTECAKCGEGLYSLPGQGSCEYCDVGSYQAEKGMSECLACRDLHTTMHIASKTASACMCAEGFYKVEGDQYDEGSTCLPCPEAMVCPFGSHELYGFDPSIDALAFPQVKPGFMTLPESPLMPFACLTEAHCPGGDTAMCGDHRDPKLIACGGCLEGYYLDGSECESCSGSNLWLPLTIVDCCGICLFAVLLTANSGSFMKTQSSLMLLILGSLLFTNFQVKTVLSFTSVINLNIQFTHVSCFWRVGSGGRFVTQQLVAPLVIPWLLAIIFLKKYFPVSRFRSPGLDVWQEAVTAVGSLLGTFFISLLMSALSPFICFQHPGNAGSSIRSLPDILCDFSDVHAPLVVVALLSLLCVPFPFLANAIWITWKYSRRIAFESRRNILQKYRFLFVRFHPHAYFYGLVLVLRSLLFCMVPVCIRNDPGLQVVALAFLIMIFTEVQCVLRPWRAEICNAIDAIFNLFLMVLLVCAPMASGFSADQRPLQILGMVAVCSILALAGGVLSHVVYRLVMNRVWFDIFLCHHKKHAAAQVRFIKTIITSISSHSVFIDSDDLVNLDGLFDIVKSNVGTLVVYLTAHTLQRAWCCGEVVSAYMAKVKVRTVYTSSFIAPSEKQLESLDLYISQEDSMLAFYGISYAAVQDAFKKLLGADAQAIRLDNLSMSGSVRLIWVSMSILNRQFDPGNEIPLREHATADILVLSSLKDDEAISASGYLSAQLMEFLKGSKAGCEVLCVSDHPKSRDIFPQLMHEAFVVIVLLSMGTLNSSEELRLIDEAVAIQDRYDDGRTMIPVHTGDFAFPTRQYFEVAMPQLFPGEDPVPIAERMKSCLKRISIMLPMAASEDVLSTQAQTVFQRIPAAPTNSATSSRTSQPRVRFSNKSDATDLTSGLTDSAPTQDFKTSSGQDDQDFTLSYGFGATL